MTAGFEKGGFTANQQLPCGGSFDLGGNVYHDWNPTRHTVTYQEGLVQSCDVVFYTVGKKLDDTDPNILPTYARAFGLGQLTGIQGVAESPGVVPDPQWKRDTHQRRLVHRRRHQPLDRPGIPARHAAANGEHLQQHRERRHDLAAAPRLAHPQRRRLRREGLPAGARRAKSRPRRRISPSCSRRSRK